MNDDLIFALAVLGYGLIAFAVVGLAAAVIEAWISRRQDSDFKAYRIICGQAVPLDEAHKQAISDKRSEDKHGTNRREDYQNLISRPETR